jgi:hypothetical protein
MQTGNLLALDTLSSNSGTWVNVGRYTNWSLHVTGLESGGSIALNVSNSDPKSGAPVSIVVGGQTDDEAGNGTDQHAPTVNGFTLTSLTATNGQAFYNNVAVCQWVQLTKTPGGSPTRTIVRLYGLLGY